LRDERVVEDDGTEDDDDDDDDMVGETRGDERILE
jgi:hypothetical protein